MSAFALGFSVAIGWLVIPFVFWLVQSAFGTGLDLGD